MKYLIHHGIIGQKWGIRRYQNKDGTLTSEGKRHYNKDDEIVTKGTKIYRVANSNEKIDDKRKYVSITDNDRINYVTDAFLYKALPLDYNKSVSEFTYEAKKDLRIASGKDVMNKILDKYGDKSYKSFIKEAIKDDKLDEDDKTAISILYESIIRDNKNKIFEDFKKEGYDAMVDPVDWYLNTSDYPLVVLDPKNSLKLKNKIKLY